MLPCESVSASRGSSSWPLPLPSGAAIWLDELAGGRPLGDRVGVVVGGQDHRAAVPIGAGADTDHRLEPVRPGRDPGAGLGVQHLHPVVACVGNIQAAVVVGDVSGVVEASGLLGPARPHTPPARAVGAVGGDLVVAGIRDVDGALVRIDAGRIHGGVRRAPIVFTQVGAGGGVTAADTGSGDAASSPNDTATSGAMQRFTPGRCGKCCPLCAKYRGCAHPADFSNVHAVGADIQPQSAPSEPPQPAPPVTARRCARPP